MKWYSALKGASEPGSNKRPKFTAKARSSPSLRTRQEAPGADQPILNGENEGTVTGFCYRSRNALLDRSLVSCPRSALSSNSGIRLGLQAKQGIPIDANFLASDSSNIGLP